MPITEDDTFEALRRISFTELLNGLYSGKWNTTIATVWWQGGRITDNLNIFWKDVYQVGIRDTSIFRIQIRLNLSVSHIVGWTADEFIEELGKKYDEC